MFGPRPRKPLVGIGLSALLGIALADFIALPAGLLFGAVLVIAGVLCFWPRRWMCWFLALLTFSVLHTARHGENPARRFATSLQQPRPAKAEGVVWSEPVVFDGTRGPSGATFWIKLASFEPAAPVVEQLALVRWKGAPPVYGDRVRLRGSAEIIEPPRNPGQFDMGRWLARQGVHFQISAGSASDCAILSHGHGEKSRHFAIQARTWIKTQLDLGVPPDPEVSTLISSMILGMRGETPTELKELFQKTGTLHLFAVSGLNVGMLVIIAWYVLRPFGMGRRVGALVIVPLLITYAIIVGMSASCARATMVGVFLLLAPLWERDAVPMNSLAAAALAILAWDTNELFNPGFQLSFVLVVVIVGFSRRLQTPMERWAQPDDFLPRRLWNWRHHSMVAFGRLIAGTVAVGVSSWLGSLLFMWGYFHLLSPVSLLANVIAVPLAFIILGLGLMSLVTSALFLTPLTVLTNYANWQCARWLIAWVRWTAEVPQGYHFVEWPAAERGPVCEIVALDAGEGAAIHARTRTGDWLVDAGHRRDYTRFVLPYLRSRGIDRLDGLILTHGDTAHVGGAQEMLSDLRPAWIGDCPGLDRSGTHRVLHTELVKRNYGRRFFQRGDVIPLGDGAVMRVLYPPANLPPQNVADEKALVLRVEARGRRVLLTSDIGFSAESWLLKHEPDLVADVMIKGWADHDFSGTPDFIAAVRPQAIICADQRFESGKLEDWTTLWRKRGVLVLPQAEKGAVKVAIGEEGEVRVWTWRK